MSQSYAGVEWVFRNGRLWNFTRGIIIGVSLHKYAITEKYIQSLYPEFVLSQVVDTVTRTGIVKRGPQRDTAAPADTANTWKSTVRKAACVRVVRNRKIKKTTCYPTRKTTTTRKRKKKKKKKKKKKIKLKEKEQQQNKQWALIW